jgi:hypothetical protein
MIQNSEVLTREANRISLVSARQATTQEDYPAIAEMEIPMSATEQTWIFEAGEKARAGRATFKSVNTMVNIIKWLSRVGTGKIDDRHLEARHNIHHNVRINSIGL